jgi:hypothetical protein
MLAYYSWYDYYYFYNWNYLFKESNYNKNSVTIIATIIGWLVSTILNIIWII